MKKLFSGLMATAVAASVSLTSLLPVQAAPIAPRPAAMDQGMVQTVQDRVWVPRHRDGPRVFGRPGRVVERDGHRRGPVRVIRRGDGYYYNGHRGYRHYRPGYRQHNGFWFPAAAFITGAIIGGALNSQPAPRPVYRGGGNAHVQWCYNRYRSYRASDNSFQPYNGPRQQCYSPYS